MPNGIEVYLLSGYNAVTMAGAVVTANVSGQPVYLQNDGSNNVVKISGEVSKISGQVIYIGNTSNSQIAAVTTGSVDNQSTVNPALDTIALLHGYHRTNANWVRIDAVSPVSGEGYRVLVAISGQIAYDMGATLKGGAIVNCTAASGGTQLTNISGMAFYLRNISGNQPVYIGSSTNPPEIATPAGYPLYGGEQMPTPIRIDNLNKIRVAASISGQSVAWFAVA